MAVTSPQRRKSRAEEREPREPREPGPGAPEGERKAPEGEQSAKSTPMRKVLGYVLAFAALAVYFIWLGNEMGGATSNGGTELAAVFGAIVLAVAALAAGALFARRGDR